jgi:hypothetical protein
MTEDPVRAYASNGAGSGRRTEKIQRTVGGGQKESRGQKNR